MTQDVWIRVGYYYRWNDVLADELEWGEEQHGCWGLAHYLANDNGYVPSPSFRLMLVEPDCY